MLSLNASFFIQLAIFLVVMTSLNFLIFKPLGRRREISDSFFQGLRNDISAMEEARENLTADYNGRMELLKKDLQAYRNKVHSELDREKGAIIEKARKEAEALIMKEEERMRADVVAARQFLNSQTVSLAEAVFSKVMGRGIQQVN